MLSASSTALGARMLQRPCMRAFTRRCLVAQSASNRDSASNRRAQPSQPTAQPTLQRQQQVQLPNQPAASTSKGSRATSQVALPQASRTVAALALPTRTRETLRAAQRWLDEHVDPRVRGLILLNLMTILLGSNYVVVKQAGAEFDPFVFAALRFTLAAAAFVPFLGRGLRSPSALKAGIEIGLWSALGYTTQSWALQHTDASRTSLLSTFTVLAVPLLAGLSGEKIKPLVWACSLMALLGTGLLEQGGGTAPNWGDVSSVLSALFFALQIFRTEGFSRKLGKDDVLPLMAVTMAATAAVTGAGAAVLHWQDFTAYAGQVAAVIAHAASADGDSAPLWQLAYTAWCSTDLALFVEVIALQSVTSTEAAMIYSVEPISGAAMAYMVLGERWGSTGWLGAGIILAASLVTQFGGAVAGEGSEPADRAALAIGDGESLDELMGGAEENRPAGDSGPQGPAS